MALEGAAPKCGAAASKVTALPHGEPLGADGYSGLRAEGGGTAEKAMTPPPARRRLWAGGGFEGGPTYYDKQRATYENGYKGGGRAERSVGSHLWGRTGAALALGTPRQGSLRPCRRVPKANGRGAGGGEPTEDPVQGLRQSDSLAVNPANGGRRGRNWEASLTSLIVGNQLGRAVALEGAAAKCAAAASKVTALPHGEPPGGGRRV